MTIILYDLANTFSEPLTVSPHVWKARISLNFKGLPYKTEWINIVDLESMMIRLGAPPTAKKPDGSPRYTLPVIYDPKTEKYVSDSWEIAKYLDKVYPDKPILFPQGTTAAIALLQHHITEGYADAIIPNMQKPVYDTLPPNSKMFFREFREKSSGKKFEELFPSPTERVEIFDKAKAGLAILADILDKNAATDISFFGDRYSFTYADIIIVSYLVWPRSALPPEEWEMLAGWNDRKWGKIVEATKIYQIMH